MKELTALLQPLTRFEGKRKEGRKVGEKGARGGETHPKQISGYGLAIIIMAASQLVTRSTRHSPKSYDELTGG